MKIDILVNPFCMAERDVASIGNICEKQNVDLVIHNLWHIDDDNIDKLPDYIGKLIKEWRNGERPGSVYCNVFVDGERIPLNQWSKHLKTVEDKIISVLGTKR